MQKLLFLVAAVVTRLILLERNSEPRSLGWHEMNTRRVS